MPRTFLLQEVTFLLLVKKGVLVIPWTRWLQKGDTCLTCLSRRAERANDCPRKSLFSELALFQLIDVVGEFQRWPQFQAHVLHHHVTSQQE